MAHTKLAYFRSSDRLFNEESLEESISQGNAYVGADECTSCHSGIVNQWKQTSHATAFNTLIKVHRNYYPRCVVCHSVGFGYETGYELGGEEDELLGVQCESCHGPGKKHIRYATGQLPLNNSSKESRYMRRTVTAQHCMECHDQEHSPGFDAQAYLHQECAPMMVAAVTTLKESTRQSVSKGTVTLDGPSLYQESGCATCHGQSGTGTALGPSLKQIAKYWKAEELGDYIQTPSTFRNKRPRLRSLAAQYPGVMPEFQLSDRQRESLVEFLLSNRKVDKLNNSQKR